MPLRAELTLFDDMILYVVDFGATSGSKPSSQAKATGAFRERMYLSFLPQPRSLAIFRAQSKFIMPARTRGKSSSEEIEPPMEISDSDDSSSKKKKSTRSSKPAPKKKKLALDDDVETNEIEDDDEKEEGSEGEEEEEFAIEKIIRHRTVADVSSATS